MAKRYTLTLPHGATISSPDLRDLAGLVLSAALGSLTLMYGEYVIETAASAVKEKLELPDDELAQALGDVGTLEVIDD